MTPPDPLDTKSAIFPEIPGFSIGNQPPNRSSDLPTSYGASQAAFDENTSEKGAHRIAWQRNVEGWKGFP